MRVPWPFARAPRASAEPTAVAPGAPRRARHAQEWRDLPPTESIVRPPVLTSDRRAFDAARAGSRPITPVLADITAAPTMGPILSGDGAPRPTAAPRVWIGGGVRAHAGTRGRPRPGGGSDGPRVLGRCRRGRHRAGTHAPWRRLPTVLRRPRPRVPMLRPRRWPATGPPSIPRRLGRSPCDRIAARRRRARLSIRPGATSGAMTAVAPAQRAAIEGAVASPGRLVLAHQPRGASAASGSSTAPDAAATAAPGAPTATRPGPALSARVGLETPLELARPGSSGSTGRRPRAPRHGRAAASLT